MFNLNRTIFFSYRIHGNLLPDNNILTEADHEISYLQKKNEIINILLRAGLNVREVIRPEIYKHQISFSFLSGFQKGDIHLIFKPLEYIRPLKNSYNIWVNAGLANRYKAKKDPHPFYDYEKMITLVDEIWNIALCNYPFFKSFAPDRIFNIFDKSIPSQLSKELILTRLKKIINAD